VGKYPDSGFNMLQEAILYTKACIISMFILAVGNDFDGNPVRECIV